MPKSEETLNQDMVTLSPFLQTCTLKLSPSKTVTTIFYLNNRETKLDTKFPTQ